MTTTLNKNLYRVQYITNSDQNNRLNHKHLINAKRRVKVKVKVIPCLAAHRAVLISISLALSLTPISSC
jgi:hypothetical protein